MVVTGIYGNCETTLHHRDVARNVSDPGYYHTNHLGSTAFVTDANATLTQGFLYAPFGEIVSEYQGIAPSSALPKYTFNAKELDEESGMYYYEARYYNPPVFTSRDPMFEQKPWLSPYHYCSNNPANKVDPTGCEDEEPPTQTTNTLVIDKHIATLNRDDGTSSKFDLRNKEQYNQLLKEVNTTLSSGSTITGTVALPGEKSNATFRLTNSKGELDFKFYSNGWKGNQYVTPIHLSKLARGVKIGGNVLGALSTFLSFTQAATTSNATERNWHIADGIMGVVGAFGGYAGFAASLYYFGVVKNSGEISNYIKQDAVDRADLIQNGYPALRRGQK